MLRVSIIGASGYGGGELLRLLLAHPHIKVGQVTSESNTGKPVHAIHPNLRGVTDLKFVSARTLEPCDMLCLALPHGEASKRIAEFTRLAPKIIDLSADFRLRDAQVYQRWYGEAHAAPAWLDRFVYGLPEVSRAALKGADFASGVGCNATAAILALLPLAKGGLIDTGRPIIVDIKVGSSEGGASPSLASHHPERSGAVRSFAPTGHRHTAEVEQALDLTNVHLSITSVELVRGVLATAHVWTRPGITDRDLWSVYRQAYRDEPFVRLVKAQGSVYRYPEPKLLAGTNWADVGFEADAATGRVVSIAAIDNLGKGAAGSALQCLNLMCGFDERAGLTFAGLHPI